MEHAERELSKLRVQKRGEPDLDLARLVLAVGGRAIVIVGGEVRAEKLQRLKEASKLAVEWVPIDHAGTVTRRLRSRTVGALIVLDGLVDHGRMAPLMDAARTHRIPVQYAGKGGLASLERALLKLNEMVA